MTLERIDSESYTVFEVSNEIANKIGGIYTVISSKASEMQKALGAGNYLAIGLYNSFKVKNDFEELEPPQDILEAFRSIRLEGIDAHYGRWIGGGHVECILVDPSHLLDVPLITGKNERKIDEIKSLLWEWFKIDSLWMSEVFDPMVAFGWAAGVVISKLLQCPRYSKKQITTLFHEWISAPGLLFIKKLKLDIATIFMTHATQLGRNIAMGEEDINEVVEQYLSKGETIPPQKAYQYHVEGTHQLEVVCAEKADILLTVSEAVAREAECILGRVPDFIIPNGINFDTIVKKEDIDEKHYLSRLQINRFIEAYFNPYYPIDSENLLIIHISGRYEFHNKGIDVFLESLKIANEELKKTKKVVRNILAFIWIPAPVAGIRPSVSNAIALATKQRQIIKAPLLRIEDWLSQFQKSYKMNLTKKSLGDFFFEDEINELTNIVENLPAVRTTENPFPPVCPFKMNERDTIYQTLVKLNLTNNDSDHVKVIFYPIYLSKNDGLLGLNYNDAVVGCDMGIYPSTYEPFGLTPLEALALSIPAVTTDLSGFGLLVNNLVSEDSYGLYILKRKGISTQDAAKNLANIIIKHSTLSSDKITEARKTARDISEIYSWRNIISEYLKAFKEANKRKQKS